MIATKPKPKDGHGNNPKPEPSPILERQLPSNVEAEQAVIGSILLEPGLALLPEGTPPLRKGEQEPPRVAVLPRILSLLHPGDFYLEKHRWMYEVIVDLHEGNGAIDVLTVSTALDKAGHLSEIGGASYITSLLNAVPTAINIEHYAHLVRESAIARRLIEAGTHLAELGYDNNLDAQSKVAFAETLLDPIQLAPIGVAGSDPGKQGILLDDTTMPPLGAMAKLPAELGTDASIWLDNYIAFSRKYAPRAYEGFHEACALFLLSVIAARRIVLYMGIGYYTNLFIALVARTTLFTKSTAAEIAIDVLDRIGIGELMLPDTMTPQKLVEKLATRVPEKWDDLSASRQETVLRELRFAGQRGWFYEEFGGMLRGMVKRDGVMNDFESLLRVMDDNKPRFETATIGRGTDTIDRPYLALLGNMTPDDLGSTANKGNRLWGNGFWARWVFVSPNGDSPNDAKFPDGERIIPSPILTPLREWHDRLGLPQIQITPEIGGDGKPNGRNSAKVLPVINRCELGEGVKNAYYNYDIALRDILRDQTAFDFDGNYGRLPVKALRVAMLLASLENNGRIEMRHWARAQSIAEHWRANLHHLVEHVNTPRPNQRREEEDRILKQFEKCKTMTARDIGRKTHLPTESIEGVLAALQRSGIVVASKSSHATHYHLVP